ncbi:hypothetical protein C5167_031656 [Papaver somniferum]|uniref:Cupin type-1 domain-containing protein n=1 Tax=Papaver somniferum TaxID=3469 RepID=A0A4Y7K6C9_PAPSO|nr:hypothetical protein C5167_031656 [Papaver somniferum]
MAAMFRVKTTSSFFLVMFFTVILYFTLSCFSADPDPLQDICVADLNSPIRVNGYPCKPESQVTTDDFFFSGLRNGASTANPIGFGVRRANASTFPGLYTQGVSVNRVDLAPGGISATHVHPRASESNFVIKGKVLFGFVTTANVLYYKVLRAGEITIIPRGLVHFAANVGRKNVIYLSAFNSVLPGISPIPNNLFASTPTIPNYILAKNFRVDDKPVSQVTSNDFFFSGLINAPSTANPLGHGVRIGNVSTFHGLNTLGLMVNRIDLTPGGVTPIHRHPRASEANIVLKGKVLSGFISASDVLYLKVQKDGELFIIPRGLVHFATNVGPQKAVLIAGYNSQLPGFASIPSNLFASTPTIPNYILAKNFRVDEKFTAIMKSKFSPTGSLAIANGDDI